MLSTHLPRLLLPLCRDPMYSVHRLAKSRGYFSFKKLHYFPPAPTLQSTLVVTSVYEGQLTNFCPSATNANTISPLRMRNCFLTPLDCLMTNFVPSNDALGLTSKHNYITIKLPLTHPELRLRSAILMYSHALPLY